tara:strand:+ start:3824 stop:4423 length:600 start_codon:yes stop_codon:yes gene_type:complete
VKRILVALFFSLTFFGGQMLAQGRTTEQVEVLCPSVLGVGIENKVPYCNIEIHRDAVFGILMQVPSHRGEAILSFDLHNRHTYSEEEASEGRAYAKYMASIAIATMSGEIITRGVVLSEFRSESDLYDRVKGTGILRDVNPLAPLGAERIYVTIPEDIDQISVVGQSLEVIRAENQDVFQSTGRAVAALSDALISYLPQ